MVIRTALLVLALALAIGTGVAGYKAGLNDGFIDGERSVVNAAESMSSQQIIRALADYIDASVAKKNAFTLNGKIYSVPWSGVATGYAQQRDEKTALAAR